MNGSFRFGLGLLLFLTLPGCATLPNAAELDVSLVNLRFAEATVLETTAVFTLRLQNESPAPVRIVGGVHKFYLNGSFVGKGLTSEEVEIPRFSSVTQPVTVYLRNISMAGRIKSLLEARKVNYRINSVLHSQRENRRARLHLSSEGTFDLQDYQPSPRATP